MGAHRQDRLPYTQTAQQIDRRGTDRRDPHIRLLSIIKRGRRSLLDNRYLKSLLCQSERQCAADHPTADHGDFGFLECHGQ
ncbi:hypothetical protein D3C87_1686590 [compost metagenome]